ncbi:MAG: SURF1 family protein [Myxococcota bacterium]|nr:SURF1 family protein [Myxococcota bacterium]
MSRFKPPWYLTLCVLAVAPALAYLGFWQLSRNREMTAHKAMLDDRIGQDEVILDGLGGRNWPAPWRRVRLKGEFTGGQVWVINRYVGGALGHDLIAGFRLAKGGVLLVDRGWVPEGPIPDHIDSPEKRPGWAPPSGPWELSGLLRKWHTDVDAEVAPQRFRSLDGGRIAKALGLPIAPYYLDQGALLSEGERAVGFPRRGFHAFKIRSPHLSYAVQWFSLCVTLLVLYVLVGVRRARAPEDAKLNKGAFPAPTKAEVSKP